MSINYWMERKSRVRKFFNRLFLHNIVIIITSQLMNAISKNAAIMIIEELKRTECKRNCEFFFNQRLC